MTLHARILVVLGMICPPALLLAQTPPPSPDAQIPAGLIGKRVTLADFGSEDLGYLVVPKTPPTMGVILVPDAYGLDNFTLGQADRLSELGYIVVAVDVYNGQVCKDEESMRAAQANVNEAAQEKTIIAAIRLFKESPRYHAPHIAAIGWGSGATALLSLKKQKGDERIDASVLFYPDLRAGTSKDKRASARFCALFPTQDPQFPKDDVFKMQKRMQSDNKFDSWFIEAGARWANPVSKFYNPVEDGEAWRVAMGYLNQVSSAPVEPPHKSLLDKVENIFK